MNIDFKSAQIEVEKAKTGDLTLHLDGKYIYSRYDPRREAGRAIERLSSSRVHIIGLGLGHIASLLKERLAGIFAFEGETARLKEVMPERCEELRGRIREFFDLKAMERAIALAAPSSEFVFDPVVAAFPSVQERLSRLLEMLAGGVHAAAIHLKTAGDVVRSVRAVEMLSKKNPGWKIDFITERPYGELLTCFGLSNVIELDPATHELGLFERPLVAFNLGADPAACAIMAKLDAPFEVGFVERNGSIILNDDRDQKHAEELSKIRNRMNRYHFYQVLCGFAPDHATPSMKRRWSSTGYGVVQFGAGSGALVWEAKRVDPRIVGDALRRIGGKWIAVGGPDETVLARAAGIPDADIMCGKTSWNELVDVLAGAAMYVGHDSGPTHIAAALGVPTLCLFGFTSPILNTPIGPRVLVVQADMPCAFSGCRIACPEMTCVGNYSADSISIATSLLREMISEKPCAVRKMEMAAALREHGLSYFLPGISVENTNPFASDMAAEPRIGLANDRALALTREWIEKRERY